AVPFLIYRSDAGSAQARPAKGPDSSFSPGPGVLEPSGKLFVPDAVQVFDEFSVREGFYGTLQGEEFIRAFFGLSTKADP
ncbi:MAG TPA: hypothetical protein PKY68_08730, partial [Bacteroidales bacterium]|nr:hypothetical protein [Bacteroidales bacterium]